MIEKMAGLTAFQATVMTIGDTIGMQLGPIVAGFLLCSVGHISIIYMILTGCLIQFTMLITIAVTSSLINKKMKKLSSNRPTVQFKQLSNTTIMT